MTELDALRYLSDKGKGNVDAIVQMDRDQRREHPSWASGENYNRFRDLCAKAIPGIGPFLPFAAEPYTSDEGTICRQSFAELLTGYTELYEYVGNHLADYHRANQFKQSDPSAAEEEAAWMQGFLGGQI